MSTSIELFIHELGIDTRNAEKTAASFPADIKAGEPAAVFVYKGDSETIEVLAGETGRFATVLDIVENGTYAVANGSQIRDGSGNYVANQFTTFVNDSSGASIGLSTMADVKIGVNFDSTYNGIGTLDSTSNLGYSNIIAQTGRIHSNLDSVADPGIDLLDSATLTNQILKVGNITGQSVDSAALETFVHTTHTSLHRGHFREHTSGQIQDLDGSQSISQNPMYWDNSVNMTTIGGRSVPNTNTSYNLGTLRGLNWTWPQHFTIYAIYYPRGTDQDEWYQHLSNQHLVQIERTDNNGTMYVGGNNDLQNTGLKVPHAQWSRIIITGSASSTTTGASTTYEAYVNGVKGNTITATGVVGRHLASTSGTMRFRYYYYNTGYFLELGVLNEALSGSDITTLDMMLNYQLTGVTSTQEVLNISTITDSSAGNGIPSKLPPDAVYDRFDRISSFDSNRKSGLRLNIENTSESNFLDLQLTEVMDETGKVFVGRGIDVAMNEFGFSSGVILSSPNSNSFDAMVSPINRISHTKDTPFYSPTSAQASSMSLTIAEEAPIAFFKDSLGMGHGDRFELLNRFNDPRLEQEPVQQSQTSGPVQIWY